MFPLVLHLVKIRKTKRTQGMHPFSMWLLFWFTHELTITETRDGEGALVVFHPSASGGFFRVLSRVSVSLSTNPVSDTASG